MKKKVNRNAKHIMYISLFNTKEWHELRARKIRECQGLCERCKQDGIISAAKTVHHIQPVEGVSDEPAETLLDRMKERCFRYDNLILLCPNCHHRTHEEMKSHRHQMYRTMPKAEQTDRETDAKDFIESVGGTYLPPTKKGVRKTRFGWVTREEYEQKKQEEQAAWLKRMQGDGLTNTQATPTVDAFTKD